MKQTTTTTKPNNNTTKPNETERKFRFNNCFEVTVKKIELEVIGKDKLVNRIRFYTDMGEITTKPRLTKISNTELLGFELQEKESSMFTLQDFVINNPMLKMLVENCKKSPQKITISYVETEMLDEQTEEIKIYKFMYDNQFKSVYYEPYHKENKENLEKQQKAKSKYETIEM